MLLRVRINLFVVFFHLYIFLTLFFHFRTVEFNNHFRIITKVSSAPMKNFAGVLFKNVDAPSTGERCEKHSPHSYTSYFTILLRWFSLDSLVKAVLNEEVT